MNFFLNGKDAISLVNEIRDNKGMYHVPKRFCVMIEFTSSYLLSKLSELDIDRQLKLLEITSKYQTLITTTSISNQFKNYNSIFISNGSQK